MDCSDSAGSALPVMSQMSQAQSFRLADPKHLATAGLGNGLEPLERPIWAQSSRHAVGVGSLQRHGANQFQISVPSASVKASSTSTPRYLTVLSILVCPNRNLDRTKVSGCLEDDRRLGSPQCKREIRRTCTVE